MTIFRAVPPPWKDEFLSRIVHLLRAAHPDMTRIAALLRDTTKDIWTESPTDDSKITQENYSLEGFRIHVKKVRAILAAYNTAHGADLQAYDAPARTAINGYLSSTATLATAFGNVIANYQSGGNLVQQRVSQADRNTLATAIEAELQA